MPTFYSNGLSLCYSRGDGTPGLGQYTSEGRARDIHPLSRRLVIQAFNISEPHRLQFVLGQHQLLQLGQRNPLWFEIPDRRLASDRSLYMWTYHPL